MRPRVNTEKRINQYSLGTVSGSTTVSRNIVTAVAVQDINTIPEVANGTIVSAVYLEIWWMTGSAQPGFGNLILEKTSSGASSITHADALVLNAYPNKKNIFYTTQGLIGDSNTNPVPIVRQWFKIPKSKQRFGLGDQLSVSITNIDPTSDIEFCGLAIFKAQN